MLFKRKIKAPLSLEERAAEAALNGAVATSVFEAAAYELDASSQELTALSAEVETEAERVLDRAFAEADTLRKDSARLTDIAQGYTATAGRLLAVLGGPPGPVAATRTTEESLMALAFGNSLT